MNYRSILLKPLTGAVLLLAECRCRSGRDGKLLYDQYTAGEKLTINTEAYKEGLYSVRVSGKQTSSIEKLLIKHH